MSSLTEQERLGLDEVFLSISANRNKGGKLSALGGRLRNYFMRKNIGQTAFKPVRMLNHVQKRLKSSNLLHLLPKNGKKKKNLSK